MQDQKKRYQIRYIVLITLIMGALLLTYRLAAEPFFAYLYLSETQNAYETIRELEWEEFGPDEETLEELDEIDRRIPVVIADDTFTLLYGQKPAGENADFSAVIRERKEEFTEDARAVISHGERSKLPASVSLYGRISIGGRSCYVYLHRNISGMARRIRFTGLALTVMAVIFLLVCIILFLVLSERFCRPYVKMTEDLRKVLDGERIPDQASAAGAGRSETYELINRLREKLLAYDAQVQNYSYMAEHEMGAAQREQGTQKRLVSHITH